MYAKEMYCISLYDCTEIRPHRLVDIGPSFVSARTTKQYIKFLTAVYTCFGGFMLSTVHRASKSSCHWLLVNCTPRHNLTTCPLSVAVDYGRYLLISLYIRPGNDLRWRLEIDRRGTVFFGEHKLW